MAVDLALRQDASTGEFDIQIGDDGDFLLEEGMSSSILVSLLSDRRAKSGAVIDPTRRRGWIGDVEPIQVGYQLGSDIWQLETARALQSSMNAIAQAARQGLQWMLDNKVVASIEVTGELTGPDEGSLTIKTVALDGQISEEFIEIWRKTGLRAGTLPPRIVEEQPFAIEGLSDIIFYADAGLSEHIVDSECGIQLSRDLIGSADLSQAVASRRPSRFLTAGGWIWRFDGADDFLSSSNQPFPSLREGTLIMVEKPTAAAADGRSLAALGPNGVTALSRGIVLEQRLGSILGLSGSDGSLEVSAQGPASTDASVGLIARWSSGDGAEIETAAGQTGTDASYSPDIGAFDQIVLGANYDGSLPDPLDAAGFEASLFAIVARRVSDLEVFRILEFLQGRTFTSPTGEPFGDCAFFTDNRGFVDG